MTVTTMMLELVSPTLPVRAQIAEFFAGAPDTTW
jgi:hypothetical protein